MNLAKTFPLKLLQRLLQLTDLIPNDMRPKISIWTARIAVMADSLGHVEHDDHGDHMVLTRKLQESAPSERLHIGCVNHDQLAKCQSFACNEVE